MPAKRVVLLLVVLALASGCTPASTTSSSPSKSQSKVENSAVLATQELGPLDDPAVLGITLDDVFARAGRSFPLPSSPDCATISKIVFFPGPGETASFFEVTIRYGSGVELYIRTGQHDLAAFSQATAGVKFRDGQNHVSTQAVGNRDMVLVAGGIQAGIGEGHRVRPVALWNESGLAYTLYSPGSAPEETSRLASIVSSVK